MATRRKRGGWLPVLVILLVIVGVPLAALFYQSARSGMSLGQVLDRAFSRAGPERTGLEEVTDDSLPPRAKIDFLVPEGIGDPASGAGEEYPLISHVISVDLDADGLLDILVSDMQRNRVAWLRQDPPGEFTERLLGGRIAAPAQARPADLDGDGDLDVAVASLGILSPSNDRIGSVVLLENDGEGTFSSHVVLERVARVSDIRVGDLDGDGDPDLVLAQFGYDDGETRWLENRGGWRYESHPLQSLSGPINCPVADLDGDGDLDILTLVSQEWEEVYVFENDGKGDFTPRLIYGSPNEDFGSSGITLVDLDDDGDLDALWTNGDAFDYLPPRPRPWHGIQWLRNEGGLRFTFRRLGDFAGVTCARAVDLDGDGDLDLVASSTFNLWSRPDAQSLIWLENDNMRFSRRNLATSPTHLLSIAVGDFDGDGRPDLVTGGMHFFPPFDRIGRITLWRNRWGE